MTNKNKLVKYITDDFNKEKNYNSIIQRIEKKYNKKYFIKYATIPVVFIIIIALIQMNNNQTKALINNNINEINNNIIINEINETITNSYDIDGKIQNGIFIPYFDFLKDLKIPSDFDNKEDMRAMWVKSNPNSNDYDILHNYEFHLRNTKNNREFIIYFSDKYKIFRCVNPFINDYPKSIINGVELPIIKGSNYYLSSFSYKGYNIDIEGIDVTEEEFVNLLESIIK